MGNWRIDAGYVKRALVFFFQPAKLPVEELRELFKKKTSGDLKLALKAITVVIFSHVLGMKFKMNDLKNHMTKISALILMAR